MTTLRIAPRYCGPPDTANGGYVAGLLAAALGDAAVASGVEVTLRAPASLGRELAVLTEGPEAVLRDGELVLARARPLGLEVAPPPLPDAARVAAVRGRCRAFETHPFPGCFVCGPERPDGLEVFPGVVGAHGLGPLVGACWRPAPELADADGVQTAFLWAALDCTTAFPLLEDPRVARELEPMVLGRMACAIHRRPVAGEPLRVLAWARERSGRKGVSEGAVATADDEIVAVARAICISLAGRPSGSPGSRGLPGRS